MVKKGTDENGVSVCSFCFSRLFLQQQQMKKGGGTSFSLFCHLLLFAIETDDKKEGGNSVHFFLSSVSFYYGQRWQKRAVELPFPFSVSSFLHSVINPIPTTECEPDITNPKAQTTNLTSKNVMWLLCTKIYEKCAWKQKERNWKFHWHTRGTYTISLLYSSL